VKKIAQRWASLLLRALDIIWLVQSKRTKSAGLLAHVGDGIHVRCFCVNVKDRDPLDNLKVFYNIKI
jgi:hypothetical protein